MFITIHARPPRPRRPKAALRRHPKTTLRRRPKTALRRATPETRITERSSRQTRQRGRTESILERLRSELTLPTLVSAWTWVT